MEPLLRALETADGIAPDPSLESIVLSLLMAFVVGHVLAWVYMWTHGGLSYSRSFTQSLVLLTMVVSLVMHVIGNSIITAFGLIGALAIIRFRNVLKDTRDTSFVFLALVLGMAIGSQRFAAAIAGTVVLLPVAIYLHATAFGTRGRYDGHLSCVVAPGGMAHVSRVLERFCRRCRELSARHALEGAVEHVWQVRLRDPSRGDELVAELLSVTGIDGVSLVLRDELSEV